MHRFAGTTLAVGVVGAAAMLAVTVLPAAGTNAGEFGRVSVSGGPAFSPDPCDGTYLVDPLNPSRGAPRLPVQNAIWSPDAREVAGGYDSRSGRGWNDPVVVNLSTGKVRKPAPGAQAVIAWGASGMVISGPDPRHPRVGPVSWWLLPGDGTQPVNLGRSLSSPEEWHQWASPVSPSGRYVAATSRGHIVVIDVKRPDRRVTIPTSIGTVHVGWTPSGKVMVAKGDEYQHPKRSIRIVRPSTGQWAGVAGRRLRGGWTIQWSTGSKTAFILTDEVYKYVGSTRRTLARPVGWLLTTEPRVEVKEQPAWENWPQNHPETVNWPRPVGMSRDGRQVAVGLELSDPKQVLESGTTITWGSTIALVGVNGDGISEPIAASYALDSGPDSEFGCSLTLTPAPAGDKALLIPRAAGCGPRRRKDHLRATVEEMVPWLKAAPRSHNILRGM